MSLPFSGSILMPDALLILAFPALELYDSILSKLNSLGGGKNAYWSSRVRTPPNPSSVMPSSGGSVSP
jgi:hypothetical protein